MGFRPIQMFSIQNKNEDDNDDDDDDDGDEDKTIELTTVYYID